MVDWREMFKKYIEVVGRSEGVHFLDHSSDWTAEEWQAIMELDNDPL